MARETEILAALSGDARVRAWRANIVGAAVSLSEVSAALNRAGVPQAVARKVLGQLRPRAAGKKGQSDITGILANGRRLDVEVKDGSGRESTDQARYRRVMTTFGGLAVVVRSTEELAGILDASGVAPISRDELRAGVGR